MFYCTSFIGMAFDGEARTDLMAELDTEVHEPGTPCTVELSIDAGTGFNLFGKEVYCEHGEVEVSTDGVIVEPTPMVATYVLPIEYFGHCEALATDIEAWLNKVGRFMTDPANFEANPEVVVAQHYDRLKPFTKDPIVNDYMPTLLAAMVLHHVESGVENVIVSPYFCEEQNVNCHVVRVFCGNGDALDLARGLAENDLVAIMSEEMMGTDFGAVH